VTIWEVAEVVQKNSTYNWLTRLCKLYCQKVKISPLFIVCGPNSKAVYYCQANWLTQIFRIYLTFYLVLLRCKLCRNFDSSASRYVPHIARYLLCYVT